LCVCGGGSLVASRREFVKASRWPWRDGAHAHTSPQLTEGRAGGCRAGIAHSCPWGVECCCTEGAAKGVGLE
jgi:hypothetical protein